MKSAFNDKNKLMLHHLKTDTCLHWTMRRKTDDVAAFTKPFHPVVNLVARRHDYSSIFINSTVELLNILEPVSQTFIISYLLELVF